MAFAGLIPGVTPVFKFGRNLDIDTATTPEDIIDQGGEALFPNAASTLSIVSDSANDTNAGTGINTMIIVGLNSDYEQIQEEVTLAGLTPVITTNSYLRVFSLYATLSGSLQESDGIITATHNEGLISQIPANEAQSLSAIYTVAADHTLMIFDIFTSMLKKSTASQFELHFEIKIFGSNSWRVQQPISTIADGASSFERGTQDLFFRVPEKTDIRLRVHEVSTNDIGVSAGIDGLLLNNGVFKW
jgi:hypothetical protein